MNACCVVGGGVWGGYYEEICRFTPLRLELFSFLFDALGDWRGRDGEIFHHVYGTK